MTPIVETLLNTLEAERYVPGPLLATIVDELAAAEGLELATEAARAILERLESGQLDEMDFAARVAALRHLVDALTGSAEAKEVLIGDALARAAPRHALVVGSTSPS